MMDLSSPPKALSNIPMTRVVLINGKDAEADEVTNILTASPKIKIEQIAPDAIGSALSADSGDLIILNVQRLEEAETEILNSIRMRTPETPVIFVSPQMQADEMRRLFKSGITDWLPKPLNPNDLFESIIKDARSRKAHTNKVHAVISTTGGAGASTVALGLADMAANRMIRKHQSVALFDLDFSLGNAGVYANLLNDFKLSSVAASPRRVDAEFIRAIQKKHDRGFYLYSFLQPELNGDLNGYELVLRLLDAVSFEHEHTFLDIPYYMTEWREDVLNAVNTATLVTEINLGAIRHTIRQIEAIQDLRGKAFPLRVLFNKHESHLFGQRVGRKQIRELLGDVPFDYIPNDPRTVGEAVDRGLLPSQVRRRAKLVRALHKYLKQTELLEAMPA